MGIDLAWSEQNCSAAAIIDEAGVVRSASARLKTNEDICRFAKLDERETTVIAIDAPLIVKNAEGSRPVEKQLTSIFGPYDAGPYPANLSKPIFRDTGRIQLFARLLDSMGYRQDPYVRQQGVEHRYFEVFRGISGPRACFDVSVL